MVHTIKLGSETFNSDHPMTSFRWDNGRAMLQRTLKQEEQNAAACQATGGKQCPLVNSGNTLLSPGRPPHTTVEAIRLD